MRWGGRTGETKPGDHPWVISLLMRPRIGKTPLERDGHPPRNARRCGAGAAGSVVLPICSRWATCAPLQADGDQPQRPRQGRGKRRRDTQEFEIPHPEFPGTVLPHRKPRRQGLRQRPSMRFCNTCATKTAAEDDVKRKLPGWFREIHRGTGELADSGKIAAFFDTESAGSPHRMPCPREFKFSILDDFAAHYGDGPKGRGASAGRCGLRTAEKDGTVVLDFKTDHVTESTVAAAAERYRFQVQTYAEALSRTVKCRSRQNTSFSSSWKILEG